MRRLAASFHTKKKIVKDESIHANWLYPIVFELASTTAFSEDLEQTARLLRGTCTPDEVKQALDFLLAKGFLKRSLDTGKLIQSDLTFEPFNDVRRIDLQRSHMRFLELAKHRLVDDTDDREYQGLTIGIPQSKIPLVKSRIRDFTASLQSELACDDEADQVLRIQVCAFRIA